MVDAIRQQRARLLDETFDEFGRQWPSWAWLKDRLQRAGLEPTWVRELDAKERRRSWVLLAKPSDALVNHFDLAPEVLVLCSPWQRMQAQDIEQAENVFQQEAIRIDPGFALVLTGDPEAQARLQNALPEKRRYLFMRSDEFQEASDPQAFMRGLLRNELGNRRLFDVRRPAAGRQFFGRYKELEALERDLLNGQCVGVFGLRKVGKTSLLQRVAEKFREAGTVVPIEVDLQEVPYNQRTFAGAAELIGRRLDSEVRQTRLRAPTQAADPLQRLADTIEHVQRSFGGRVLLMLDEYEVLLSGRGFPQSDGVELLTWLRGMAQAHASSFGLVLAGRNATLLAPARINGADNPMYRFLRHVPLAGLSAEDCREMVQKIGRRMALRFTIGALEIIVRETGGHPGLARTLGNFVDAQTPTAERAPATISDATLRDVLPRFARDVYEDMRELVAASNDFDPSAEDYLVRLAYGGPPAGDASAARLADALVGYGILHDATHAFRIGQLETWLRENYAPPAKVAHG